ncbi:MAG TPA: hypothetical protein VHA35_13555 [Dongiaceae bacterium]|nr:hypothetical protein [Dongiaceae bacterium]
MKSRCAIFRAALPVALLGSVSACSIIDPHVTLTMDERDKIFYRMEKECTDAAVEKSKRLSPYCKYHGSLPAAIEYANALSQEYDGAVSSQSILKNGIALGVIPASAAALFLGISGGSTETVLGLASGGAALLGLGGFLSSEPRQQVYISGSLALGCAILKSSPYLLDEQQYKAISPDFTAVQAELTNDIVKATKMANDLNALDLQVVAKEDEVRAFWPAIEHTVDSSVQRQTTASSIEAAQQVLSDAGGFAMKALTARIKVDDAGVNLLQTAHDISEKVSREVTKTEPDVNTIRALAAGLAPAVQAQEAATSAAKSAIFPAAVNTEKTPGSGTGTAQPAEAFGEPSPQEAMIADALDKAKLTPDQQKSLRELQSLTASRNQGVAALAQVTSAIDEDTQTLRESVLIMQPLLDTIAAREQQAAGIPECTVASAEVGFTISPPVTDLPMKVGETKGIVVNGAVGNASGTVVAGKADGISFATAGNGTGLVVNMTAKTPGTYVVAISDSTGKGTKTINVNVATGLTIKVAGKDATGTIEIAKNTDTDIAVAGGNGTLDTSIPGDQTGLAVTKKSGDASSGSVTIKATGAGPYKLTIIAGDETKSLTVTAK